MRYIRMFLTVLALGLVVLWGGVEQALAEAFPSGWKFPFCGSWSISCGYGCSAEHGDGSYCTSKNYHAVDWNLAGETDYGQLVVAPASGTVKFSGSNGGYSIAVVVDAGGGYFYRVSHLIDESVYRVREGQYVTQGKILGLCGRTGKATGSHIHFSVHYPASYSGGGAICGPSVPQNGISGAWDLRGGIMYGSNQYCQCR